MCSYRARITHAGMSDCGRGVVAVLSFAQTQQVKFELHRCYNLENKEINVVGHWVVSVGLSGFALESWTLVSTTRV